MEVRAEEVVEGKSIVLLPKFHFLNHVHLPTATRRVAPERPSTQASCSRGGSHSLPYLPTRLPHNPTPDYLPLATSH